MDYSFEEIEVGDVVVVFDDAAHDYTEHKILVQSIENTSEGTLCYGEDLTDDTDNCITVVNELNFVRVDARRVRDRREWDDIRSCQMREKKTLEDILKKYFGCDKPFLDEPVQTEYNDYVSTEYFTLEGGKAYGKLTALLYDLSALLDGYKFENANDVVEFLDGIVNEQY